MLLLSMSAIKLSGIDIDINNFHVDESFEGRSASLKFKDKPSKPAGQKKVFFVCDKDYYTSCNQCQWRRKWSQNFTKLNIKKVRDDFGWFFLVHTNIKSNNRRDRRGLKLFIELKKRAIFLRIVFTYMQEFPQNMM